jgi:hypothetical protein
MIVVSSGGVTHKHPEPVKVGDIWEYIYPSHKEELVVVNSLNERYVWLTPMHPDREEHGMHLVDFYGNYKKAAVDVYQPPQTLLKNDMTTKKSA